MRAGTRALAVPARPRRSLPALVLSVAALSGPYPAFAQQEAPACPNPPPLLASAASMRDGEVALAVRRIAAAAADEDRDAGGGQPLQMAAESCFVHRSVPVERRDADHDDAQLFLC